MGVESSERGGSGSRFGLVCLLEKKGGPYRSFARRCLECSALAVGPLVRWWTVVVVEIECGLLECGKLQQLPAIVTDKLSATVPSPLNRGGARRWLGGPSRSSA